MNNRWLKYLGLTVLIFILILIFLTNETEASFSDFRPVIFIQRTTNLITKRVSDIVYYLVMQKKYIFDDYTDPNVYPTWQIAEDFDDAMQATALSSSQANEPLVIFGEPIVISTSSISIIKTINSVDETSEIFNLTNIERKDKSIGLLTANSVLNDIASLRIDDMFNNQYFSHESPNNKGVADLAKRVNYDYLLIGENLALGNYNNEKEIVQAWMNSPGHRANILNAKYTELGVAIREDIFKGQTSTIAVQVFADPISSCKKPSTSMKLLIDTSSQSIKDMQEQAKPMYNNLITLRNTSGLDRSYYNQKIQEYNYFAKKINDAMTALKSVTDYYNSEVVLYNACIR